MLFSHLKKNLGRHSFNFGGKQLIKNVPKIQRTTLIMEYDCCQRWGD